MAGELVDVAYHYITVPGGGERHVLHTARLLDAMGYRVRLVLCGLDPRVPRLLGLPLPPRVEVRLVGDCGGLGRASRLLALALRFHSYKSDADVLVKFQGLYSHLARGGGVGVLYSLSPPRFMYDESVALALGLPGRAALALGRLVGPLEALAALRGVRVVAANSGVVAGRLARAYRLPRRAVEVVYPPVDVSRYRFREFGDFYLLVSRLEWHKRVHVAVKAFEGAGERLVVAGDGPLRPLLESYIRRRGLRNVELLGRVPEDVLVDLYSRARAVIYIPANEDFGLVPVEAAASGKPTIAADEGGLRETVVHGETGFLVRPTPGEVRRMVKLLSRRDDLLEEMKPKCLRHASRFSLEAYARRLRALLDKALAGGPRGGRGGPGRG